MNENGWIIIKRVRLLTSFTWLEKSTDDYIFGAAIKFPVSSNPSTSQILTQPSALEDGLCAVRLHKSSYRPYLHNLHVKRPNQNHLFADLTLKY